MIKMEESTILELWKFYAHNPKEGAWIFQNLQAEHSCVLSKAIGEVMNFLKYDVPSATSTAAMLRGIDVKFESVVNFYQDFLLVDFWEGVSGKRIMEAYLNIKDELVSIMEDVERLPYFCKEKVNLIYNELLDLRNKVNEIKKDLTKPDCTIE